MPYRYTFHVTLLSLLCLSLFFLLYFSKHCSSPSTLLFFLPFFLLFYFIFLSFLFFPPFLLSLLSLLAF
jgi:hypothetical protein